MSGGEQAERLGRLRERLAAAGIDGFLATDRGSVRYLSGYAGSNGLVGVTAERAFLLTDFRYAGRVEALRELLEVRVVDSNLVGEVAGAFDALFGGAHAVAFESAALTHHAWAQLDEAARRGGHDLVPTTEVVEGLRAVKSAPELERIARAARLTDEVYASLAAEGLAGKRERDVAFTAVRRMRELGAEGPSFPPIVTAAGQGAIPHGEPRDVDIERGTLVVVDLGAVVDGYCSDCTRTYATGPTSGEMKEVYEVVLRAQEAALALVRAGTVCADVHAAARAVIDDAGYGELFNHGTGHGVGLDVHEQPRLRAGAGAVLEPGNVVTVEPGVYVPERFGVRIEDLVVVTPDGHEVLTRQPKSLADAA